MFRKWWFEPSFILLVAACVIAIYALVRDAGKPSVPVACRDAAAVAGEYSVVWDCDHPAQRVTVREIAGRVVSVCECPR